MTLFDVTAKLRTLGTFVRRPSWPATQALTMTNDDGIAFDQIHQTIGASDRLLPWAPMPGDVLADDYEECSRPTP